MSVRHPLAALALVFLLTSCATQPNTKALLAAEAVAADLVTLEQQVAASGPMPAAETAAFLNAISTAQAGVAALTTGSEQPSSVLASITAVLQAIVPFLPAIATIIGLLAEPAPITITASHLPALNHLQADLGQLRDAGLSQRLVTR